MCVLKNIPIGDPCMAVCLASIMRDGSREIGHARATRAGRNEKAHQLYEYILTRISDLQKFSATEHVEHFKVDAAGVRRSREVRSFEYVVLVWQDSIGSNCKKKKTLRKPPQRSVLTLVRKPAGASLPAASDKTTTS